MSVVIFYMYVLIGRLKLVIDYVVFFFVFKKMFYSEITVCQPIKEY